MFVVTMSMLMSRNLKHIAANIMPTAMTGMESNRIRLLPIRSIMTKAIRVNSRFVRATDNDVSVGDRKPTRENIDALKYLSWC